ncbi:1-(5-phosphoribosyl)-5-[(5-phosphoribosylamino)methylideneamino] imidazole-4-carboxamide isomerase OS=Rhodanobacter lindaniclasticus OX=75310 GN=hisA PE=3 SV=1 [Rhodanobacter lindaniclasticus]
MNFDVIPAIDLRGGRVVRLKQGDYAQQTTYAADPRALALRYANAGARRLHLVDLDGAARRVDNLAVIEAIAADGMAIQAGGGAREASDLQRLFDAGVERVVLGSVAIRDPNAWPAGWAGTVPNG